MRPNRLLATAAAAAASLTALVAAAVPASAHVTIPEPVVAGGFGIITCTVPNERDDAGTVSLEVQHPRDEVLASVRPQPKAGWTVETTARTLDEPVELFGREVTEVVDTVTWTADDGTSIEPGQFDTFSLQAGPFPEGVDALAVPAIQICSSGEEVAWIEETPEGGEEPESPAPLLSIVAGDGEGGGDSHGAGGDEADEGDEAPAPAPAGTESAADVTADDDGTDGVAVAALVVGVVAAVLAGAALVTGRRRAA